MKKTEIRICQSCGRDNPKSDPQFKTPEGILEFYRPRLAGGPFVILSRTKLCLKDCLTNCDTPNSAQVCRGETTFDFAWISTKDLADEVVKFARELEVDPSALPNDLLQKHLLDQSTGRGKTSLSHPLQPQTPKPIWIDCPTNLDWAQRGK